MPRQSILDAGSAGPRLLVSSVSAAELPSALSASVNRGFDLAREPPLHSVSSAAASSAAALAPGSEPEHVLLLLLHHIAGDGWSLAPLSRDLSAFYAARLDAVGAAPPGSDPVGPSGRRGFRRCRCNMPRYAVAARAAGGRGRCRQRDGANCRSGGMRLRVCRISLSCRATGRGRRCRAIAAAASGLRSRRSCTAVLALARDYGGCSWCCRPGLRRC